MEPELKQAIDGLTADVTEFIKSGGPKGAEFAERLAAIETKLSKSTLGHFEEQVKSIGEVVTDSDQYKSFFTAGLARSGKIPTGGSFFKSAIVSSGDLFAPAQRLPGVSAVTQRLTIRDLLRNSPATSNLIEYVREVPGSTTNAAAPQGKGSSPQVYENVAKAESAISFELVSVPVQTVAHWIPASRQVLDDSAALRSFLNGRGLYFLKLVEEAQLLNGTGSGGDLEGLVPHATQYDNSDDTAGDTKIDTIRHGVRQVEVSGFAANGVVLHPTDWEAMELIKTTGTSSSGQYIFSPNARVAGPPTVWGLPAVISNQQTVGTFLVGDFQVGAELFDRQQSSVEVSREHADFFIRNMAAVLFEERLALVIYQADAFRAGSFPVS